MEWFIIAALNEFGYDINYGSKYNSCCRQVSETATVTADPWVSAQSASRRNFERMVAQSIKAVIVNEKVWFYRGFAPSQIK